jgi:mRNA interferase MazF
MAAGPPNRRIRGAGAPSITTCQYQFLRIRRSGLGRFNDVLEDRLKRGDIWTPVGDVQYAGKPRPVVVVQHELFETLDSVTICGFSSDPTDLPLFRILIEPSPRNGLEFPSRVMVDKILTVRKAKLGYRIGHLEDKDVKRLDRAIVTFLGLTN